MSLIENGSLEGEECLRGLCIKPERSYVLDVTSWQGAGKSTLKGLSKNTVCHSIYNMQCNKLKSKGIYRGERIN